MPRAASVDVRYRSSQVASTIMATTANASAVDFRHVSGLRAPDGYRPAPIADLFQPRALVAGRGRNRNENTNELRGDARIPNQIPANAHSWSDQNDLAITWFQILQRAQHDKVRP